jgi:hypothetical protein
MVPRALVFAGAGVLLVGLAFLVGRPRVPDPATNPYAGVRGASRAKAAGLQIYYARVGDRERAVQPATVLRAGDQLRFVIRGERPRHVEVRLRDGQQPPVTLFPVGVPETSLVAPGQTLPGGVTVAPGGGKVVVTATFSDSARPVGAPTDAETETITIAITKD